MTPTTIHQDSVPDTWYDLIESLYDLRPIKNRETYGQAMQVLRVLMRHRKRNRDQSDYLKTLCALIGDYEAKARRMPSSHDPLDNLRFLLEENEMTASDLGRLLGDRSLGTRLLSGERDLSKAHIRKLSDHFRVSPAAFI